MIFDGIDLPRSGTKAEFKAWQKRDVNPLGRTSRMRTLHTPNEAMKYLHDRLVINLRRIKAVDLTSAASKPGGSALRNVLRHRHNRYFYLTDISSAFDSVDSHRLAAVLAGLDTQVRESEVYAFLRQFCMTEQGGLITGSPSSPDLFNIYCAVLMDGQMREYCLRHEVTYSRYLDDLTFSSKQVIGARKREKIRELISLSGLRIGHHKSRVLDLKKHRIEINGIGLEYGGRVYLPRWYLYKIRGLMHVAERSEDPKLLQRVHGMIGLLQASTDASRPRNRLETKVFSEYAQLRHQTRKKPFIPPPQGRAPIGIQTGDPWGSLDDDDDVPF
ncbi:hypothetical protein KW796_01040 [Candidatus Parcubacteria bacterium]|nr:hypothetical protein [Candidatus Parcubacteria bacterium]